MTTFDDFEGDPCVEPSDLDDPMLQEEEAYDSYFFQRASAWYPGAWRVEMGGNGNAITARPGEDIFHIAASSWNINPNDPQNSNVGIPGWNKGAKACNGYNDQFGNMQQYASIWSAVNGTYQGNWRCRTWEAWNPEGLNGTSAQYNSSKYTGEQCERFSDYLAWMRNENELNLQDMQNSRTGSHTCGVHRYGIPGYDPYDSVGGEKWTLSPGKVCPGSARVRQLSGIIDRAVVISNAVRAGRCGYLSPGRVDLAAALARTGGRTDFWYQWGFAS